MRIDAWIASKIGEDAALAAAQADGTPGADAAPPTT